MPRQTPSMTVGPFFAYGLAPAAYGKAEPLHNRLAGSGARGMRMRLCGRILDSTGKPIDDALIEIWQADSQGRYPKRVGRSAFRGHGRCATDESGCYSFETIKPASVEPASAPHINAVIFARGLLNHMFTRIYFADEKQANRTDPVLQKAGSRRKTMVAAAKQGADGLIYSHDIVLSGKGETVFLDI